MGFSKRLAHVFLAVVGGEVTLELSFFSPALSASVIETDSLTAGSSLKSFGCATPFRGGPGRARLEGLRFSGPVPRPRPRPASELPLDTRETRPESVAAPVDVRS